MQTCITLRLFWGHSLAPFIPDDKIAEVKSATDIVDVVSESVLLKKSGRNFVGLCPFHSEKTPSFTVSSEKQIFYCFGCGAGGNAITYLMKHDGYAFPEAVRFLAGRYGVDLPKRRRTPEQERIISEKERLLDINKQAMEFFSWLLHHSRFGTTGSAYLAHRGFSRTTIESYRLGFAPEGWDRLLNHFQKKGTPLQLVEKSGLILARKDRGGFYDRFRNRIMFPILSANHDVIAFGGRVLDDALPKYLNSPETPVYSKSRSLYGLHSAKIPCREQQAVYIVEGYFDLLAMVQHGFPNCVATLGTALTPEHVKILRSLIGQNGVVKLVFDSDAAGLKAAERSVSVFDKGYVDAQIIVLPDGHDPDTFLFKNGDEAFEDASGNAVDVVTFLMDSAIRDIGLSIHGKSKIISRMADVLRNVGDKVKLSLYVHMLAERLGVNEEAVLDRVRRRESAGPTARRRGMDAETVRPPELPGSRLERKIISMMIQFPKLTPEVIQQGVLDHFENKTLKTLGSVLVHHHGDADPTDAVADAVDGAEALIAALSIETEAWNTRDGLKLIHEFLERSPRSEERVLLEEIKQAEKAQDKERLERLLEKKYKLAVQKQKQRQELLGGA